MEEVFLCSIVKLRCEIPRSALNDKLEGSLRTMQRKAEENIFLNDAILHWVYFLGLRGEHLQADDGESALAVSWGAQRGRKRVKTSSG